MFDFALVEVEQELLFRGLIYRAFDWRGSGWAIWGSSICFGFWHSGGEPLMIAATAICGVIFALLRRRTGGILGLIPVHGLIDFTAILSLPNIGDATEIAQGRPQIPHPAWMVLGLAMIVAVPLYLWLIHHR